MDLTQLFCNVDDFMQQNSSLITKKLGCGGKRKYNLVQTYIQIKHKMRIS